MTDETVGTDADLGQTGGAVYARAGEPVVDSRTCGPAGCGAAATTVFDALETGGSFVLVADHDPVPIRYMLDATRPSAAEWEPLTEGPELWRTRIRRVAVAG